MKEFKIGKNESGQRFDKFLVKYLKNASSGFIYKMLRKKNITLNDSKASGSEILSENDNVKFYFSDDTFSKMKSSSLNIDYVISEKFQNQFAESIIYEDDNILIINKPCGMLSQSSDQKEPSAVEYLIDYLKYQNKISIEQLESFHPAFCNRLDRNTTGILIAGKTFEALQVLNSLFKERTISKYYYAIVYGRFSDSVKAGAYLKKDPVSNKVRISDKEFEESTHIENEFEPVKYIGEDTLLKIHLITGKTHQIRAHLAHLGHPVIGDIKYGNASVNNLYKANYNVRDQLLHAGELIFPKEIKGSLSYLSEKCFTADLPNVFQKIIDNSKN